MIEVVGREVYALYNAYIDAALDGERTTFERQLSTPGRPPIWIRVDYYPDRTPQGHIRGFLVTYADVDNLKHVELEAGQREHRLRLVIDSVGSPIFYFDRQLKIRFANKPFGDWIGAAADDLLGHAVREMLSGEAFAELQGYIERAFAGATVSWERRDRRANGDPRWVRISLFPDREPGGRIGGAFAVMTDIEDDVRIRDALKAQEVQLRLFADNIPGPIAYLDQLAALHVREPGVRELGRAAAGRDLRQVAARSAQVRRVVVPPPDPEARADRASTSSTNGSARTRTATSAGCTAASRRTSTPPARCAVSTAPSTTSTI